MDRSILADLGDDLMEELERDFSNELDIAADELLRYDVDRRSGDRDSRALLDDKELLKTLFDVDEKSAVSFDRAPGNGGRRAAPTATTTGVETASSKRGAGSRQSKRRGGVRRTRRLRRRRRRQQHPTTTSHQIGRSQCGSKRVRRKTRRRNGGAERSLRGMGRNADTGASRKGGAGRGPPVLWRKSSSVLQRRAQHRSHNNAATRHFLGGCGVGDVGYYADQGASPRKWDSKERLRDARRMLSTAAVGAALSIMVPAGRRSLVLLTVPFVHVLAGFCLRAASRCRCRYDTRHNYE